jgi:hypothetical protein
MLLVILMRRSRLYREWLVLPPVSLQSLDQFPRINSMLILIAADSSQSAGSLLLAGLKQLPSQAPGIPFDAHATVFSCFLFAHLLRNTEACKRVARELKVSDRPDGQSPPPPGDDEDEKIGLVHIVVGNLMMAQREQSQLAATSTGGVGGTAGSHLTILGEWSRVMVGYLVVLCVWMWESPRSVREFLSEGSNLQVVSVCFVLLLE